jgi:hypothetical protein
VRWAVADGALNEGGKALEFYLIFLKSKEIAHLQLTESDFS